MTVKQILLCYDFIMDYSLETVFLAGHLSRDLRVYRALLPMFIEWNLPNPTLVRKRKNVELANCQIRKDKCIVKRSFVYRDYVGSR